MVVAAASLISANPAPAQAGEIPAEEKLVVVWTSGDRDVALKMVFMYTYNAKKNAWWDDITLVVWGPSAKLLTEDKELQEYIARIKDVGVDVRACKGCADLYGVSSQLEELGVNVLYIGKELTDYIKEGRKVLTF
ncbi:MAG: DsrE family protein [Bacteroidetes bacterium]|nr:DsrE family protein [Bacteroidota bacterium]